MHGGIAESIHNFRTNTYASHTKSSNCRRCECMHYGHVCHANTSTSVPLSTGNIGSIPCRASLATAETAQNIVASSSGRLSLLSTSGVHQRHPTDSPRSDSGTVSRWPRPPGSSFLFLRRPCFLILLSTLRVLETSVQHTRLLHPSCHDADTHPMHDGEFAACTHETN